MAIMAAFEFYIYLLHNTNSNWKKSTFTVHLLMLYVVYTLKEAAHYVHEYIHWPRFQSLPKNISESGNGISLHFFNFKKSISQNEISSKVWESFANISDSFTKGDLCILVHKYKSVSLILQVKRLFTRDSCSSYHFEVIFLLWIYIL